VHHGGIEMGLRLIGIVLVVGLLIGSVTLASVPSAHEEHIKKISVNRKCANAQRVINNFPIVFSRPEITCNGQYVAIEIKEANSSLTTPGNPMLPSYSLTRTYPLGTHILNVSCKPYAVETMKLEKKVIPAPTPIVLSNEQQVINEQNQAIYESSALYPQRWYNYRTAVGLHHKTRVIFLTLEIYPVRYNPVFDVLYYPSQFLIEITFEKPHKPITFSEIYDLLIITPSEFSENLQPLIAHKQTYELDTKLITLDDIYSNTYFMGNGRDQPEKIKYFIKEAIENWGITYVLLVGGRQGQKLTWHLPVRYTNNHAGERAGEKGFISDLYYGDIYKDNEGIPVFDDWDSNENDVFAEFTDLKKDRLDCLPDVYVGRLACRYKSEVDIMVSKIINYEKNGCDPSWFNRMLLVGGDTYPHGDDREAYEGEIDTNLSASYMDGFEIEKLWPSLGTLTDQTDVEKAINKGAGFIHMAGHANPSVLVTYPPKDVIEKITILQIYNIPPVNALQALSLQGLSAFFDSLTEPWMPRLQNGEKLPIIVVGGCHNSQFNTTMLNILKYGFRYAYGHGIHAPKCWSWWLTSNRHGGAIATIGNTGLGMGLEGYRYTEGLDGWLLPRFFYNYGVKGKEILGEAHGSAITDYANTFEINQGDGDDRQMITQWALLGDPSLQIGGYSD
jgi:hypothetical protein